MVSKEEDNFLRIVYLHCRVATGALTNFFDKLHPSLSADLNKPGNKAILQDLYIPPPRKKRVLYRGQWDTLYPPPGPTTVTSADLDLTLIICLLRNIPPLVTAPPTGFDNLPAPHDKSDAANIPRLKYYYNFIVSHTKDGTIPNADFVRIWSELEQAITGLDNSPATAARLKDAKTKMLDNSMAQLMSTQTQLVTKVFNFEEELKHISSHVDKDVQEKKQLKQMTETLDERLEIQSDVDGLKRKLDEMVPTEIRLMADKRSVPLYLELLESGSEKKRDIRLVIVGKKGAGKTSLIRRLFSERNTKVSSTNGIEIHRVKCKAMSDDGIWNKLGGTNEETEIHGRLLKQYIGKIEASLKEGIHDTVKEHTGITTLYKRIEESKESETVTQQTKIMKSEVTTESQVEPLATLQQPNQFLEQAKLDIEIMLKSDVDLHDKEEYAKLLVWDFAGDEEFYHTHQTFLSADAIYLVVTKLNEADDKNAQA